MKRIIFILFAIGFVAIHSTAMAAMSTSKVRKNTRFLTDRMAYELNLSPAQYNDVYEINFDFIYNIRYLMNDVMRGYEWALDDYYQLLDIRNDDLRWVLSSYQYARFLRTEYFYRPVYASGNSWNFRVYIVYNNPNFFYFGKPVHYRSYKGGHYRTHHNNISYYRNKYHHDIYHGQFSTKQDKVYYDNRQRDFGVSTRPSSHTTPGNNTRPTLNTRPSSGNRPAINATGRPSSSNNSGTNNSQPNTSVRPSSSSTGSSSRPGNNSGRTESNSSQPSNSNSSRPSGSSSQSTRSSSRPSGNSSRSNNTSSRSNSSSTRSQNSSTRYNNSSTQSKSSTQISERPSSSSSRNSSSSRSNSSSSNRSSSQRSTSGGRR